MSRSTSSWRTNFDAALRPASADDFLFLVTLQKHKHPDGAHIRGQPNLGDGERGTSEARILQFSRQHQAHFVADFLGHALAAMPRVGDDAPKLFI